MKIRLFILFLLLSSVSVAGTLDVRLFSRYQGGDILFSTRNSAYHLIQADTVFFTFPRESNLHINDEDTNFTLLYDTLSWNLAEIHLQEDTLSYGFFLNFTNLNTKAKAYTGSLTIRHHKGQVLVINHVDMEDYVAAVVEAEGGYSGTPEYYKTQAVICRTYALKNLHRHEEDGFQLCDGVHCQAFHGKAGSRKIIDAVNETRGLVIVDQDFQLINAVYHSNSGGQTANSIDVWSSQLPYLVAVQDTFSLSGKHAEWERIISLAEWKIFLENKGVDVSQLGNEELKKRLESRIAAMKYGAVSIPMREIRKYFALKSAYFDVEIEGDEVVLHGKGYGHGVGLSQEGAMSMAEDGYTYEQIIQHYYQGTSLVSLSLLDVFQGLEKLKD